MLTALAGLAVAPGQTPATWQVIVLALAVLLSSGAAGAFNHYVERDLDARMQRTCKRPFVTGRFRASRYWLIGIILLLLTAVTVAALALNVAAALYVFLGAFVYGVVYTVWLKRRTWLNIVLGGLAPVILAVVLFLWTPPHFWSLALVYAKDYAAAGVPMLPVVVGGRAAARVIFAHTALLVALSLLPFAFGLGWIYLVGAASGGAYFLLTSMRLMAAPTAKAAMANFRASLLQLSLLLTAAMLDAWLIG
jgi:protoheme IX farnesyltransferase